MTEFHSFLASPNGSTMPQGPEAILFNVIDHASTPQEIEKTVGLIDTFKPKFVLMDSGGFELFQAELKGKRITFDESKPCNNDDHHINITPCHVVEAVTNLKVQTATTVLMVGLDFPLSKFTDERAEQENEFSKKLGYNLLWAEKTAHLREKYCPDVELFIPVQAYTLPQAETFYSWLISRGVRFDGLCMPVRHLKLHEVVLFLARFRQLGVRKVHLLGSTSFFIMALGAYMARHHFTWLSLDATSWQAHSRFGVYLNPHDLSPESLGENIVVDELIANDCLCPWCRHMSFSGIKNLPRPEQMSFLVNHNYWVMENARKALIHHATDLPTLEKYLIRVSKRQEEARDLCRWISLFELCKDWDVNELAVMLKPERKHKFRSTAAAITEPATADHNGTVKKEGTINHTTNLERTTRNSLLNKTKVEYAKTKFAINHVLGCAHGCTYCYALRKNKWHGKIKDYDDWLKPRLVENALELLERDLRKNDPAAIETVYLSFYTDPFMYGYPEIHELTMKIMERLNRENITCTTLTKGIYPEELIDRFDPMNLYGITLVSLDPVFQQEYEPHAAPLADRLSSLRKLHDRGLRTWVSMEPYPTPNFVKQDLAEILQTVEFVEKIIFGRMNHNKKGFFRLFSG